MRRAIIFMSIIGSTMVFLAGCFGPGMEDYSYTMGSGYELIRTSGHQISVVPIGGNDGTKPEIKAKVVQIAWDDRYVVAKQLGLKKAYPDNPDNSYEVPDENAVQYFILDTVDLKLYGGFNFDEFQQQERELGIAEKMTLKDVNRYSKQR